MGDLQRTAKEQLDELKEKVKIRYIKYYLSDMEKIERELAECKNRIRRIEEDDNILIVKTEGRERHDDSSYDILFANN